jgi:iron complex outermembrane receptor protein
VNLIPVSAIERVDVVTDGASATYGTDAVSGVVNIVMKTDYEGAEVRTHYGVSSNEGNYEEKGASFVVGANAGKTNVTVSAEWFRSDPIMNFQRPYSAETYGTTNFPGVVSVDYYDPTSGDYTGSRYFYLNPELSAPPANTDMTADQLVAAGIYQELPNSSAVSHLFNLSKYVTALQSNERRSATIAFDHKLSSQVSAFGDFLYSNTQTFSQLNGQPFLAYVAGDDPTNPFDNDPNAEVYPRNRFITHPRTYSNDTTQIRGVFGLRGDIIGTWHWEAAANYNRIKQEFVNGGLINTLLRKAAVANGLINMFDRSPTEEQIAATGMIGNALGFGESGLSTYDAKINGTLFTLPAGDLAVAFGAERRIESFKQDADVNSQGATFGWDSGTTLDPFNSSRTIDAVFAETRIPVVKDVPGLHYVEASAAFRFEKYSDTEDPTVPKFSLRWLPIDDQFALKGSWGKSFAAPTLFQLFGPSSAGYTDDLEGQIQQVPGHPAITGQALIQSGANPALKPSHSKNYTLGIAYSPKAIKGLAVSLDYFNIKQTDLISTIGSVTILQDVETNGTASAYANLVHIGGFDGAPITGPGQISGTRIDNVYVTDRLINIASQELSGFNASVDYGFDLDTVGHFDLSAKALIWDYFKVQFLPTEAPFDSVGYVTATNGTLPTWQGYLNAAWKRGNWSADAGMTYIPGVAADYYDGGTPVSDHIGSVAKFDFSVSYSFDSSIRYLSGLQLTLGVNNAFNKMAPIDPSGTFSDANADIATYGVIGRLWYVNASYKF